MNEAMLDLLELTAQTLGVRAALRMAFCEGRADAYNEAFAAITRPDAGAGMDKLTEMVAAAEVRAAESGTLDS